MWLQHRRRGFSVSKKDVVMGSETTNFKSGAVIMFGPGTNGELFRKALTFVREHGGRIVERFETGGVISAVVVPDRKELKTMEMVDFAHPHHARPVAVTPEMQIRDPEPKQEDTPPQIAEDRSNVPSSPPTEYRGGWQTCEYLCGWETCGVRAI